MNKTFLIAALMMLCSTLLMAQGIQFETGNWASVKAKAAKENKLIYLDVYTTWCGPCKMMAKNYFPAAEAGNFYNKNFVCYKVDAEKGEGIAIAEQYKVNGYPTNLFIDGKTGKVIYRTMGMPAQLGGFIQNGHTALEERKDPMTLAQYQTKFKSGKYDMAFLKKYLAKNSRLERNNDSVIDAYLQRLGVVPVTDSLILFVAQYQHGVSNKGYALLKNNAEAYNRVNNSPDAWHHLAHRLYRNALGDAIERKDEKTFRALLARVREFERNDSPTLVYQYECQYYEQHKMQKELEMTRKAYARGIMSLSNEEIAELSRREDADIRRQITWQVEQSGVPKEKWEETIHAQMERPDLKYNRELFFANELNGTSWAIYEKYAEAQAIDKKEVEAATLWAKRAMELAQVHTESYLPIADTYAHLLFLSGDKAQAKKVQTELIERGKKEGIEELEVYQKFLDEL